MQESHDLEKQVLTYLLKDVKYLSISERTIKPTFFTLPAHRAIFKAAKKVFMKYHTTLPVEWFEKAMSKHGKLSAEEETEYLITLKRMVNKEIDDTKFAYVVDQLRNVTIQRGVEHLVEKYQKKLKDDNTDGQTLVEYISEDLHTLRLNSGLLVVQKQFVYENVESRIQTYLDRKKSGDIPGIPFGWGKLDELTGGHFKSDLTVIFSRTGGGKTRALHNISYNATVAGYKGLFITIEMAGEDICRLYDSRLTKIHFDKIKKGKLTEDEENKWMGIIRMMEMQEKMKGFYVVDVPAGCTPETIDQEIVEYERRNGKLDFCVVDYLLLIENSKRFANRSDLVGNVAEQLKKIGRSRNVSMITAAQANREALEVEMQQEVGTQHIGISDQIAHHSNTILYLWRSTQDKMKNKLQVNLVKFRDGGGLTFELYADWARNYIGDAVWQIDLDKGRPNGRQQDADTDA